MMFDADFRMNLTVLEKTTILTIVWRYFGSRRATPTVYYCSRDTQIDSDFFEESILRAWESILMNRLSTWGNRFQELTSILVNLV